MTPSEKFRTNVLAMAINELLANELMTLDENNTFEEIICHFEIDNMSLCARAHCIGYGEVSVRVFGKLKTDNTDSSDFLMSPNGKPTKNYFMCYGWLERRTGKYIMKSDNANSHVLYIKNSAQPKKQLMADWIMKYKNEEVIPNGFQKTGKFFL